jgi:copper ion binding protein
MYLNNQRATGVKMKRQIDPESGMEVEENTKIVNYLRNEKTYFFCAFSCKNQFERSPEEYLENFAGPEKDQNSHALPLNLTEIHPANLDKLEFPISGMNDAGCVSRIEKGLSKMQGVRCAKVNFTAEKASIAYDPQQLNSFDLVRAISELGYKVRTQRVILPVQGMSCVSCVNRIRATLRQVTGVVAANINFVTGKVAVVYILGQVTTEDLARAIETAGYKILEIDEDQFVDK